LEHEFEKFDEQIIKARSLANATFENLKMPAEFKLKPFTSNRAAQVEMAFISPYAFRFAEKLTQYDDLLILIFPYMNTRYISREKYETLHEQTARSLRRMFAMMQDYMHVGREASEQKLAQYHKAIETYGITEDFIERIMNYEVTPNIATDNIKYDKKSDVNDLKKAMEIIEKTSK